MMIVLVGIAAFMAGTISGVVLMAVMAAAGEASRVEEQRLGHAHRHARSAHPAAAAGAEKAAAHLSDRLVRDYTVWRDEQGVEHIVPVEDVPRSGA